MALYPLDKQTEYYKSPHKGLVRLAMELAAFVICGAENGTNWHHLVVISFDGEFTQYSVIPYHPNLHPIEMPVVLIEPVRKLSKMAGNSASYSFNGWSIDRL